MQSIVSRNVDPLKSAVVSICMFQAGNTDNVIPQTVQLRGTARSSTADVRDLLEKRLHEIVEAHGGGLRRQGQAHLPAQLSGAGQPRTRDRLRGLASPARSSAPPQVDTALPPMMGAEISPSC